VWAELIERGALMGTAQRGETPLRHQRVLVTGATGFIGRYLCRKLIELDATTYGLSRSASEATVPPGVIPIAADVTQRAAVIEALERVHPSHVVHLAAAGVTEPFLPIEQAVDVNVSGTVHVLEASYDVGVQRFVHVGTAYEHRNAESERGLNNPYVASKISAWLFWRAFVEKWTIDSVAVRLYHVYGPQQLRGLLPAAMRAAQRAEVFNMTPGEQRRDFIYITDVIEALLIALGAPNIHNNTYDIGTGIGLQVRTVVERIFQQMKSQGRYVLGALDYRPHEEMELVAAPTAAQIDLKWQAQVQFEEGLAETIEVFRQQTRTS
jgi:UDP-glucose 4-epimerase